jgi:WD40 repeat protein
MALSPDGRWLALQCSVHDRTPLVQVFDTATGRLERGFGGIWASLRAVAFNPHSKQLAAVHHESREAYIFDMRPEKATVTLVGHSSGIRGVAYSADGKRLATCGDDQTIRIWDTTTWKTLHILRGHVGSVQCVAFSADPGAPGLLISGGSDTTLRLWDIESGELLQVLHGHTAMIQGVALSADGRKIASMALDGTARLWDAMPPEEVSVLRGHTS